MRLRAALSANTLATAFILVAGFGFCLAVNLPGHLSYDSVIQLVEARTAAYAGWHPPFMSWLLGVTDALAPGTSLFVIRAVDELMGTPLAADYSTVPLEEEEGEEVFEDAEALEAEIARLDTRMRSAAERLDFEEAAAHRDRIRYLREKAVLA